MAGKIDQSRAFWFWETGFCNSSEAPSSDSTPSTSASRSTHSHNSILPVHRLSMIKLSALQSALFILSSALILTSTAEPENECINQSDQREYRKYLAGLIKKEYITSYKQIILIYHHAVNLIRPFFINTLHGTVPLVPRSHGILPL